MRFLFSACLILISANVISLAQQRVSKPLPAVSSISRAEAKEAERRLSNLGYWTGPVDGIIDPATRSALIAFQKWEGRKLTGRFTKNELEAIRRSTAPHARETGYAHIEVDIDRQVLLLVNDEAQIRVLPVSTGSGQPFVDDGQTSVAYTPRGRFIVYDKTPGWETGKYRSMYYSNYISGGVAVHGYPSVPNKPASHGCIRIPLFAAPEVSRSMPVGTIVLVYDSVTFVSGKEWALNPKTKEAAMANMAATDDEQYAVAGSKPRKNRTRTIRA